MALSVLACSTTFRHERLTSAPGGLETSSEISTEALERSFTLRAHIQLASVRSSPDNRRQLHHTSFPVVPAPGAKGAARTLYSVGDSSPRLEMLSRFRYVVQTGGTLDGLSHGEGGCRDTMLNMEHTDAKRAVIAALAERCRTQSELAKLIGTNPGTLTKLLTENQTLDSRSLWPQILDALDLEVVIRAKKPQ